MTPKKTSALMLTTLLALSAFPLGQGKAPDITLPDAKDEISRLNEFDRINRDKFPSRKKRLKAKGLLCQKRRKT